MTAILLDPDMDDAARRRALYAGRLIVDSPRPSTPALCESRRPVRSMRPARDMRSRAAPGALAG